MNMLNTYIYIYYIYMYIYISIYCIYNIYRDIFQYVFPCCPGVLTNMRPVKVPVPEPMPTHPPVAWLTCWKCRREYTVYSTLWLVEFSFLKNDTEPPGVLSRRSGGFSVQLNLHLLLLRWDRQDHSPHLPCAEPTSVCPCTGAWTHRGEERLEAQRKRIARPKGRK